jgi:urea transport system ATP-binding protein
VFGQTIDLMRPNRDRAAGIGRKFQKPTVFEQHGVENLELAMKTDKRWWASLRARLTLEGSDASRNAGADRPRGRGLSPAGLLSHGQKQRLEIGMLLMQQPSCCCSTNRWPA